MVDTPAAVVAMDTKLPDACALERYHEKWEHRAKYVMMCSDVEPLTLSELLQLADPQTKVSLLAGDSHHDYSVLSLPRLWKEHLFRLRLTCEAVFTGTMGKALAGLH